MNVCLLLAAGSSSRMQPAAGGSTPVPKMLLPFKGKTLLQHAIDEIKELEESSLVVVTGCYHAQLQSLLNNQQIEVIQNEEWQQGMGSSIQKGVTHIRHRYPEVASIIITVCDQPYISGALLKQMLTEKEKTARGIIACTYHDTIGTPVLFDKKYLNQLASLSGQYGAKKLVQQFGDDAATLPFPGGAVDIDTWEDYTRFL
jgi:molybdenum cofactor cytidylyltransferase